MTQINVKERVEALTSEMTVEQQAAIRALGNDLDLLNQAMVDCVESGLSIELKRTARHHADDGYWGDILVPKVVKQKRYVVAFDHLDPGSEIERNLARARDIRSAYFSELMLRMRNCAARWLRKQVFRTAAPEPRHRSGA